jgi:hypothetical protein
LCSKRHYCQVDIRTILFGEVYITTRDGRLNTCRSLTAKTAGISVP